MVLNTKKRQYWNPICNAYKAMAEESDLLPGEKRCHLRNGASWFYLPHRWQESWGLSHIVMVGLQEDTVTRFDVAKQIGATEVVNGSTEDVCNA